MTLDDADFEAFMLRVEPVLRRALVGTFGAVDGRQAAADALGWAWENWDRVQSLENPAGYLYRVGRTAADRSRPKDIPTSELLPAHAMQPGVGEPQLLGGLDRLSPPQRSAVLLVHGWGYTLREAAEALGRSPSTIHIDCKRALARLREHLGVDDAL